MAKITEYHRQVTAQKMASVAFWQKHPMSRTECLNQFKRLRNNGLQGSPNQCTQKICNRKWLLFPFHLASRILRTGNSWFI